MIYNTEFNITDTIFFIQNEKICTSEIHAIEMKHYIKEGPKFKYKVTLNESKSFMKPNNNGFVENVFKTKAELIKYLLNEGED